MRYPQVRIGVIGDASQMDPKLREALAYAMKSFQNYLNTADHEKIERQYSQGSLSADLGFNWFYDPLQTKDPGASDKGPEPPTG